ncbi:uncharacterized protein LOC119586129 [Penaeus monodon]|uniref:uncharacterized protein LOC119586129 n=1 Tax=Penaeus monodon TaxID=6687 RepID=UPI0018A79CFF|nr:uncharacterized protein LOC119586129 [Penaeus monodon]
MGIPLVRVSFTYRTNNAFSLIFPRLLPSLEHPIGRTSVLKHEIRLQEDAKPVYITMYQVLHSRRLAFFEQIKRLLELDLVKPSTSPSSATIILLPRKDGSLRLVIDHFNAYNARLMAIIMAGLVGNTGFLYLDDLLVVSRDIKEHDLKLGKFLQGCLGFAKTAHPLSKLLSKDEHFVWSSEQQLAFNTMKKALTEFPVLVLPIFSKLFTLVTKASCTGLGATMMQKTNSHLQPTAYASRKLNTAETHYSITDLEPLAVVWSLRHFREIILGYDIEVLTDHRPLCYSFMTTKSPSGHQQGGLMHFWSLTLHSVTPQVQLTK